MKTILEIDHLSKKYGAKSALVDLSLRMEEGEIVALLGPNGSGKTSLMKILAGLQLPSAGRVSVCGAEECLARKGRLSFLPDSKFLYPWMSVRESLDYFQDFFPDFRRETAEKMLEDMELSQKARVPELSKGMQERLNLALILSRDAELYVLDEPLGGVDPLARERISNMIIDKAYEHKTMLIATQLLGELEHVFDRCVFLQEGRILLQGSAEELRQRYQLKLEELYVRLYGGKLPEVLHA